MLRAERSRLARSRVNAGPVHLPALTRMHEHAQAGADDPPPPKRPPPPPTSYSFAWRPPHPSARPLSSLTPRPKSFLVRPTLDRRRRGGPLASLSTFYRASSRPPPRVGCSSSSLSSSVSNICPASRYPLQVHSPCLPCWPIMNGDFIPSSTRGRANLSLETASLTSAPRARGRHELDGTPSTKSLQRAFGSSSVCTGLSPRTKGSHSDSFSIRLTRDLSTNGRARMSFCRVSVRHVRRANRLCNPPPDCCTCFSEHEEGREGAGSHTDRSHDPSRSSPHSPLLVITTDIPSSYQSDAISYHHDSPSSSPAPLSDSFPPDPVLRRTPPATNLVPLIATSPAHRPSITCGLVQFWYSWPFDQQVDSDTRHGRCCRRRRSKRSGVPTRL